LELLFAQQIDIVGIVEKALNVRGGKGLPMLLKSYYQGKGIRRKGKEVNGDLIISASLKPKEGE